jgi:hypothetical protein
MRLIRFEYDVSRLTENSNVLSTTFLWKTENGCENTKIIFPLTTIELPWDIGIGVDEIINKGR